MLQSTGPEVTLSTIMIEQHSDASGQSPKSTLPIVGYSDVLSVTPGNTIAFMVSSEADTFVSEIVRITGGGLRPEHDHSPLRTQAVEGTTPRKFPGVRQPLISGSYVEYGPLSESSSSFTATVWIWPTLRTRRPQVIIAHLGSEIETGFFLGITPDGHIEFSLGQWANRSFSLIIPEPIQMREWYQIAVSSAASGRCILGQRGPFSQVSESEVRVMEGMTADGHGLSAGGWIGIGAVGDNALAPPSSDGIRPGAFDGKVAGPLLVPHSMDSARVRRLLGGESTLLGASLLSWPAPTPPTGGTKTPSSLIPTIVNSPLRAVTGPAWNGLHLDWRLGPTEYDAIWFHEDDMDDAKWTTSFDWSVPAGSKSGLYAACISTTEGEDLMPFFVRPPVGKRGARVAFLAPIYTYLAYSNSDCSDDTKIAGISEGHKLTDRERFVCTHPEVGRSLYDKHTDGSGISHVSWLRPMPDLRLDHGLWSKGGSGRELSGDLYLIDWLEAQQIAYDVFTDADLDSDGIDLLAPYKVILTGGHPEYVSASMLDALELYVAKGGRVMYLGGNGFYWVTSVASQKPSTLEVRRGHSGTRTWTGYPGENHHSDTGEPGGLWRHRGRAPQRLTGVGFDAQGRGPSAPFAALPAAHLQEWSWVFEGVDLDKPIGDFGSNGNGAAGDEVDRIDFSLGTPRTTVLLATSSPLHSDHYNRATEEVEQIDGSQGGTRCPEVRADITYFENSLGGAVFSTGSIAWSASLAHNGYQNSVSTITRNVLRRLGALEP